MALTNGQFRIAMQILAMTYGNQTSEQRKASLEAFEKMWGKAQPTWREDLRAQLKAAGIDTIGMNVYEAYLKGQL